MDTHRYTAETLMRLESVHVTPLNWRSTDATVKLTAAPHIHAFFFFQFDSNLKCFSFAWKKHFERNRELIYQNVSKCFCPNWVCLIIDQFTSCMVYGYWNRKETSC